MYNDYEMLKNSHKQPLPQHSSEIRVTLINFVASQIDFKWQIRYVTNVPDALTVEVNVPGNIHKRFHVEIVKRAGTDPYPSRLRDDAQNPPVLDEFVEPDLDVESILRARTVKRGRLTFRQAMVKWVGWKSPSWEPIDTIKDTTALDDFEEKYGPNETNNGPAESETGMFVGPAESSTVQKRRERRKAKGDHGNLRKKTGPCDG
ncbi:hypothetical protein K3495_g12709 [Podosphaera aphanis]|nr:hypothetical protein K3495_g12709 [Podosphaera aphanis]